MKQCMSTKFQSRIECSLTILHVHLWIEKQYNVFFWYFTQLIYKEIVNRSIALTSYARGLFS